MKIVELIRLESNPKAGTFGILKINKRVFCVTLEPPSIGNVKIISCIPTGQYDCSIVDSPRYGEVYGVEKVYNRENILFHSGNLVKHTEGCIILAQHFGKLKGNRAVLSSGKTFSQFMSLLKKEPFFLTIKEEF